MTFSNNKRQAGSVASDEGKTSSNDGSDRYNGSSSNKKQMSFHPSARMTPEYSEKADCNDVSATSQEAESTSSTESVLLALSGGAGRCFPVAPPRSSWTDMTEQHEQEEQEQQPRLRQRSRMLARKDSPSLGQRWLSYAGRRHPRLGTEFQVTALPVPSPRGLVRKGAWRGGLDTERNATVTSKA